MNSTVSASDTKAPTLESLGGDEGVQRWVRRFYDGIAADGLLAPMFRDLELSRVKQHAYFVEFFGGPKLYSEQYGQAFLRFKHRHVKIGQSERDAWMRLALSSLAEEVDNTEVLAAVEKRLAPIADGMINHHPEKHDAYYFHK